MTSDDKKQREENVVAREERILYFSHALQEE
jgi:hypothetical protein